MQPLPKVPGYELIARLGGGPLTEVYSGRDLVSDGPCAIKLLRPHVDDESTAVKLLQREARACLTVQHPHLVRLLHTHVTRPPYFLVMELLDGESLRRRLRRDYRLELSTVLWIARQTAEALDALHRAGFVHGDIKPDNLRLVREGHAVLLDLGFAHRPGENSALLRQGYILGTANYLAPELCTAQPSDDLASDLFSFGVMCFEMLAGQLPYPPGPVAETMRRHAHTEPADMGDYVAALPAAIVRLVRRLLEREPAERPSAGVVVQHLIGLEIATMGRRRSA